MRFIFLSLAVRFYALLFAILAVGLVSLSGLKRFLLVSSLPGVKRQ